MAWQNPKTDWAVNPKNPVPEDFNRIEGNIDFLKSDIETKKGVIVNALNTVGLTSELTDTHAQIANKIVAANQGTKIYTPGTANITIPKGFHSGQGYVKGDANLKAENIANGVSIFGINGSYVSKVIKTVQSGETVTAYGEDKNISISSVNMDSSISITNVRTHPNKLFHTSYGGGLLIANNILSIMSVNESHTVGWQVIEFYPDVIKTIQRGRIIIDNTATSMDIAINSINITKTFVLLEGFLDQADNDNIAFFGGNSVLSSSNLRIKLPTLSKGWDRIISWQVVEFY